MFGHQYRDESRFHNAGETTALRAASSSKPAMDTRIREDSPSEPEGRARQSGAVMRNQD